MLSVQLYTVDGTGLVFDATPYIKDCSFSTDIHGFASFSATTPRSFADAFQLYLRGIPGYLRVSEGAAVAWEGRLEDVGITSDDTGTAAKLTAFGYWSALSDLPYTAFWSDSRLDAWEVIPTGTNISGLMVNTEKFDYEYENGQLLVYLIRGTTYDNNEAAGFTYLLPENSSTGINRFDFTHSNNLPIEFYSLVGDCDENYSNYVGRRSVQGTGAQVTTTVALTTFANRRRLVVLVQAAPTSTYAGANGTKFSSVYTTRVKSSTGATLYADEIVKALATTVNTLNSSQLSSVSTLIQSPGVDLTDETFDEQTPAEIIEDLASRGDSETLPRIWEAGVWENKILHFQPRGSAGRTWYVDATALELERTLSALFNSVFAVFEDVNGREQRTSTNTDAFTVSRLGITRRRSITAKTATEANAERTRNASLEDSKDPRPRARIKFDAVYTSTGARAPLWQVRSGDTIVIRSLPPTMSADIDRIRSFRISRTEYDAVAGVLTVEPEAALPTVPALLAEM